MMLICLTNFDHVLGFKLFSIDAWCYPLSWNVDALNLWNCSTSKNCFILYGNLLDRDHNFSEYIRNGVHGANKNGDGQVQIEYELDDLIYGEMVFWTSH